MKNFLISTLLIFVFGNLCNFGLPWWGLVPLAALIVWFLPQNGFSAFIAGLTGGMMVWGINALLLNTANNGMFSDKIGQIFQGMSGRTLLLATTLIGGVLGAFGAMTGQFAWDLLKKPRRKSYYARRRRSGRYRY